MGAIIVFEEDSANSYNPSPSLQSPTEFSGILPSFSSKGSESKSCNGIRTSLYGQPKECAVTKEEKLPGFLKE